MLKKKKKGCSGKDLQKKGFKSGMKEIVGDERLIIISVAVRGINDHIRFDSQMLCTAAINTSNTTRTQTGAGICVPPTVLPYRVSGSTLTAVGRSRLLARWPGTHCRILSAIHRAAQTVLGVYLGLKRTCSRVTSASSALAVLNDYAL